MRWRFVLEQIRYDLAAGLLFRPVVITLVLGALSFVVPYAEPLTQWPSIIDEPGAAQAALGIIAGALMTVLSVVYSLLIMAMTMASMQFSPRILTGFLRDGTSQTTIGLFLGTFAYSLLTLRSVHTEPAYVPRLHIIVALALAFACLAWLLFFVHHIAQAMQLNYIVDRIARSTETVIDAEFPRQLEPGEAPYVEAPASPCGTQIESTASGYVQLMDEDRLAELARPADSTLYVHCKAGDFVSAGSLLVTVNGPPPTPEFEDECRSAFDVGPIRTMQQDVDFGIRQIVDVALKAISPAVNDPSTATTCTAHLGRLMMRLAQRSREAPTPETNVFFLRRSSFPTLLDLAFMQIRQYSRSDIAVSMSLLRALGDVLRKVRYPPYRDAVAHHVRVVLQTRNLIPEDMEVLRERSPVLAEIDPP